MVSSVTGGAPTGSAPSMACSMVTAGFGAGISAPACASGSSKGWVLRSGVTMRAPSTEFGVVSINGVDADTSYVEVGGETISPAELPSVPRFLPSGAGVLIQALEPGWHCRSAASCEQVIFS